MDLLTVDQFLHAFYRSVGTESGDPALTEQGEETNEVAFEFLTEGCRTAQRFMLDNGYRGWLTQTSALVFLGSDDTGGKYVALPSNFLRASGRADTNRSQSCLRTSDGTRWGSEIREDEAPLRGNVYYFRNERLYLGLGAAPPSGLVMDYHYLHPAWATVALSTLTPIADNLIDFPLDARRLIIAEAADAAKDENWFPGGQDMKQAIATALGRAQRKAIKVARVTKTARRLGSVKSASGGRY